jgi:hypothetical protein
MRTTSPVLQHDIEHSASSLSVSAGHAAQFQAVGKLFRHHRQPEEITFSLTTGMLARTYTTAMTRLKSPVISIWRYRLRQFLLAREILSSRVSRLSLYLSDLVQTFAVGAQ